MKTNNVKERLGTDNIGKLIFEFAAPCIIGMIVNSLYNIVDQIFIGRGVGFIGNAATNVAFPITTIAMALTLVLSNGCSAHMSLRLGEKRDTEAADGVGTAITLILVMGVLFAVIGSVFLKFILRLSGATDEVMSYSVDYAKYIVLGMPFFMFGLGMNSIIRADGSPRFAMVATLIGAVVNTILDPIFIFVFKWGVSGAAVATVIGQICSFALSLYYVWHFKSIHLKKEYFRPKFKMARTIAAFGTSSFITQISVTIVVIVMNNILTKYGAISKYGSEIPLSAHGIVMKVNQILMSIMIGIGVGSQPVIGYNYGAGKFGRVIKAYSITASVAVICAAFATVMFIFFPQIIINLFGQENELYNEFAVKCFRIFLMFSILNAFQIVSTMLFQAIGKPLKASLLTLSRQIIFFIPFALILSKLFGVVGSLYAGPCADFCAFAVTLAFVIIEIIKLKEQERKVLNEN